MQFRIHQFWQWFTENETIIRDKRKAQRAKDMLDDQILSFGKFAWGIDRGKKKPFVLTISPNNDPKLLAISKQIIEHAPDLASWEFCHCKAPIYDWDFKFQAFTNLMILQTFDASKWQFILIEEEDYRVAVEIKADNLHTLDYEEQHFAASRVVTNLLGEELRIEEVASVKIVHQFDPRDKEWVFPMRELRKRFLYFIE